VEGERAEVGDESSSLPRVKRTSPPKALPTVTQR
jgi:hypothetical protein